MCIIVVKPYEQVLERETLYNCWENNNDGAGIGYVDKDTNKLVVQKELHKFSRYYQLFKEAECSVKPKTAIVLHFRIATHGNVCDENIHPFKVRGHNLLMFHNGVIPIYEKGSDGKATDLSDSGTFAKYYLADLPRGFHKSETICWFVENAIKSNKIVLLDGSGYFKILNEELGDWDKTNKCWFSNSSYKYNKKTFAKKWGKGTTTITCSSTSLSPTIAGDVAIMCDKCSHVVPERHSWKSMKDNSKTVCAMCHFEEKEGIKKVIKEDMFPKEKCTHCKMSFSGKDVGRFYDKDAKPYCPKCWFTERKEESKAAEELIAEATFCESCDVKFVEGEKPIYFGGSVICSTCRGELTSIFGDGIECEVE